MKACKPIIVLLLLFFTVALSAQIKNGKYKSGENYLKIKKDRVDIYYCHNSGINCVKGNGVYELNEGFLLVKLGENEGKKPYYKAQKTTRQPMVYVKGLDGAKINQCEVYFFNKSGELVSSSYELETKIPSDIEIGKISVYAMGGDGVDIAYEKGKRYTVYLANYNLIEDNVFVYKVNHISKRKLDVSLVKIIKSDEKIRLKKWKRQSRKKKHNSQYKPMVYER